MSTKEIIDVVHRLNDNLPDDTEHKFVYVTDGFTDLIFFDSLHVWDSENYGLKEGVTLFEVVQERYNKLVLEMFKATSFNIESDLSCVYTDMLMLQDESWQPDESSVQDTINVIDNIADALNLEIEDTRDHES